MSAKANQVILDLDGAALRDQGIKKVLSNNEGYKERFCAAAERQLAMAGSVTAEDIVDEIGLPEGSRNAIGAAMRSFALRNSLIIARYVKSTRPSRHAGRSAVRIQQQL